MNAVLVSCLSCTYLFIFTPLILRSIAQLQSGRVIFFNFRGGSLRARQLTGAAATTFAGTQLVARLIVLGGLLGGIIQNNGNLIILSTLAGLALGAMATALGEREAKDVTPADGAFSVRFVVSNRVEPDNEPSSPFIDGETNRTTPPVMGAGRDNADLIEDAKYRPLDEDEREAPDAPAHDAASGENDEESRGGDSRTQL